MRGDTWTVLAFAIVLLVIFALEAALELAIVRREMAGGSVAAHRLWDPLIGPVAARWKYRSVKARFGASACVAAALLAFFGMVASPGRGVRIAFFVAFLLLIALEFVGVAVTRAWRRNACTHATVWLGVKVTPYSFPPSDPVRFQAWCQKRHANPPHLPGTPHLGATSD